MHYLHTMVRVKNLDEALEFYCNKLGLVEFSRRDDEKGKYTNVFLKARGDSITDEHKAPLLELTYNWEPEEYTGLPAPRPDTFFVYALLCDNQSTYIGQTEDLKSRCRKHHDGTAAEHTAKHKPTGAIYYEEARSRDEAVTREKWLKTGFGRKWLKQKMEESVRARQAGGRNFGHLAYAVENIYEYCARLQKLGITINRPPKDGRMAFIKSPDGISIELLQIGDALPLQEPWLSIPNTGTW